MNSLNKSQMKAIKRFINNAERFFHYINRNNEIVCMNGPVQWSIEKTDTNRVWLRADNITNEKSWFESYIHLNVLIGPRGSVRIFSCDGIERKYLLD